MSLSLTTIIKIIKLSNAITYDSGNWTCNNSNNKMGRKKAMTKIKKSNAIIQDNDN